MTTTAPLLREARLDAASSARVLRIAELSAVLAFVGVLGMLLYRPWEALPFPIVDFGGWLVVLSSADSLLDAFRALAAEHAQEGRVNPLSMAYVALNWALFGDGTVGWQVLRALILIGLAGGAYTVFRILGAPWGAALIGACMFIVADSARAVWLMPQAFEHVAASLVIGASIVALGYLRSPRPRRHAAAIAILLVLAVWVREPMVSAIPFVVLLALCHRGNGRMGMPAIDRRAVELVAIVAGAVAIFNVVPVLAVRLVAEPGGYASRFGPENISFANVRNVVFALALPVTRAPWFPANALFLVAAIMAGLGNDEGSRNYRRVVLLAATLPLCGAAIYVMWPGFPGNYGLPYLLGLSIVLAVALGTLWRRSHVHRAVALVTAATTVCLGGLLALNDRRQYAAARMLDADLAAAISVLPARHLDAAVDDPPRAGSFGRALRAYSRATLGAPPASATDLDCATARARLTSRPDSVVVLRPPHGCLRVAFPPPTTLLRRTAVVRDWKTLQSQPWEVTSALWHSVGPAQE